MYCTAAQVKDKFPQYSATQWGTGHLPSDARLEEIITEQDQLIDSYLGAWYVVPLEPDTPALIVSTSRDLAACEVRSIMHSLSPMPDKVTDAERREIIRRLEAMAQGRPPLLDWPTTADSTGVAGAPAGAEAPDPLFTRGQVF